MDKAPLFTISRRKPEAEARLFCFPHAGGGPSSFFAWNAALGPRIECVALQYPGRGQRWREAARTSLAHVVEEVVNRWEELPHKPFAFYGHSFGGLVAFEAARRLSRAGLPGPERLFVGSSRAPQLELWLPPIHQLPDEQLVEAVQARYGGIPAEIRADREVLDLFLRPLRHDLKAYECYRMEREEDAVLTMPIMAFAGAEDRSVPPVCMQGWRTRTSADFELRVLEGGHFLTAESVRVVAECIQEQLLRPEAAQAGTAVTGGRIGAEEQ